MTIEQTRQRIRRRLGLEEYHAYLGNPAGVVYDRPGYVNVRYRTGDTTGLKTTVLIDNYVGPDKPGTPVIVGYNADGDLCLLRPDAKGQIAVGGNPALNNPVAVVQHANENPFTFVPFMTHPTTPPSLKIVVRPWVYVRNGTVYHYPGEQVDLASYKPAAGEWLLVGVLMKADNTVEVATSTAQPITDGFDTTDLQEIETGASAEAVDGWIWCLTGATTALGDADRIIDFRPFISISSGSWENYTPTSTADAHGKNGDRAYDDNYLYIRTSAGWKRSALSTF